MTLYTCSILIVQSYILAIRVYTCMRGCQKDLEPHLYKSDSKPWLRECTSKLWLGAPVLLQDTIAQCRSPTNPSSTNSSDCITSCSLHPQLGHNAESYLLGKSRY